MTAVATFHGNIRGHVLFERVKSRQDSESLTLVTVLLCGFEPHAIHAFHIHQYGDLRKGCKSLGPHWNPRRTAHGSRFTRTRHSGDLVNNIQADDEGKVLLKFFDPLVTPPAILGRSLVLHTGIDDLGLGRNAESLITGNAGSRLACAIIGRAEG